LISGIRVTGAASWSIFLPILWLIDAVPPD
jgi:hypothetical protein